MTSSARTIREVPFHDAAYQNASLPVAERVADLLGRMTSAEKAAQLVSPFGSMVDTLTPPETGWGVVTASLCSLRLPPRETARRGERPPARSCRGDAAGHPRPVC